MTKNKKDATSTPRLVFRYPALGASGRGIAPATPSQRRPRARKAIVQKRVSELCHRAAHDSTSISRRQEAYGVAVGAISIGNP